MKTSLFFTVAIFLNTSILISEPLSVFIKELNIWVLLAIEVVLVGAYYVHKGVKELHKACELDLGDLNLFIFTRAKKNSSK